jgi:hypothetical protein
MEIGRNSQGLIATFIASALAASGPAAAADLSSVSPLSPETRAAMTGKSWHVGCPVALNDLAAVQVTYFGFDHGTHTGTIVVHKQLASDVALVFDELYNASFPLHRVSPWENYGSRVYAEQDDTVGFYCEKAQDDTKHWSSHAYGYAVDINPLENPFQDAHDGWWPPGAEKFVPRDDAMGKVTPNSSAIDILAKHGFAWGGFYKDPDYMHFFKVTDGSEDDPPHRPFQASSLHYLRPGTDGSAPK